MTKIWREFSNQDVEKFKEKTRGRYYVLSWVPVKSRHNPDRCQVTYRRWKPGDKYVTPVPAAEAIVTKPAGKGFVYQTVEEQEEVALNYETVVKSRDSVLKPEMKKKNYAKMFSIKPGHVPLVMLGAVVVALWYFLFGRQRG